MLDRNCFLFFVFAAPPSLPNHPPTSDSNNNNGSSNNRNNNTREQPAQRKKKRIELVTDSNGKGLNLNLLKSGEDDRIERTYRYTVSEATHNIPKVDKPEEVTDIVFQVGLNDSRKGLSATEIRESTLKMQMKYQKHFKNARQHLTALPPLNDPQIKTN